MSVVPTNPSAARRPVVPLSGIDARVRLPGSKSYTNRHIAISALAVEPTELRNALISDDTRYLASAVTALGLAHVDLDTESGRIHVEPGARSSPAMAPVQPVFMGNAGTGVRILITMAGLVRGRTVITGNDRMQQRPMGDLLVALDKLGIDAQSLQRPGSPPIMVEARGRLGGIASVNGSISSQFTSSLLLNAPRFDDGLQLDVTGDLVSLPYLDMTVAAMTQRGAQVTREGYRHYRVEPGQRYRGGEVHIEPDASNMSYFLGAAAILGGRVVIEDLGRSSVQGDTGLLDVLEQMGAKATWGDDHVELQGGPLHSVDVDMSAMPDVAPTLAVIAAFAEGRTHISNIATLRDKECDRITATATELRKLGIEVEEHADALTVVGGVPSGPAEIETYDDHRIAMCFAMAGLAVPGIVIRDPDCVSKSFPNFWDVIEGLA